MEYQKIANLLDNEVALSQQINHLNLKQEIELKQMMTYEVHTLLINKLDLKQQC